MLFSSSPTPHLSLLLQSNYSINQNLLCFFNFACILINDVVFFGSLGVDGKKAVKEPSDGKRSSEEASLSPVTSGSKSSVSSLTSDVSSFKEILAHKLRIVAFVSRCHEMKPEVIFIFSRFNLRVSVRLRSVHFWVIVSVVFFCSIRMILA